MKKKYCVAGGALAALAFMLLATDPRDISSLGLVVPFMLLFILLATLFLMYFERNGMPRSRSLRVAGLAAALPCMILVLQSVDQLTIRDGVILLGLFALSVFYVAHTKRARPRS